jgi:hypothetical protein
LVGFLRGLLTNHGAHQTPSVLRRDQFAPMTNCVVTRNIRPFRPRSRRPALAEDTEREIHRESRAGRGFRREAGPRLSAPATPAGTRRPSRAARPRR